DVVCPVNVQHNCCDNKCTLMQTCIVRQEREDTSQRAAEVHHVLDPGAGANNYILNIGQMRNSALIMPLYP
ncbi:hypothetical protein OH77DRAFT_1382267, partial [Trametes cingulata]